MKETQGFTGFFFFFSLKDSSVKTLSQFVKNKNVGK